MARRIFISMILSAAVVASGALAAGNRTVALHTTAPADPSEFGRADRTYIYSNGATEMDMLKLRDELIAAGARAVNTFLPDNVIVAELPVTRDVSGILASAPVRQMSEQQVLALGSSAARRMDWIAGAYALADRIRETPRAAAFQSYDTDARKLSAEQVENIQAQLRFRHPNLVSAIDGAALVERNAQQNSEILTGSILANLVFPESGGGFEPESENWSDPDISSASQAVTAAVLDFDTQFPNMNIDVTFNSFRRADTGYEPVKHGDDGWIADTIHGLGYAAGVFNAVAAVHEFNTMQRSKKGGDWVFTAFVACARNQPNHTFAGGNPASAFQGGPYFKGCFPAGNDPNMIGEQLVSSQFYQKGTAEVFWAANESVTSSQATCDSAGYLGFKNGNVTYNGGLGNLQCCQVAQVFDPTCDETVPRDCLMSGNPEQNLGRPFCYWTQGQLGVIDEDENDIPDVFQAWPTVAWQIAGPETVSTNEVTLHLKGIARGVPNRNKAQNFERVDYILPLKNAFYQLDGSSNLALIPDDGKLNETEEDFTIQVVNIKPGLTRFQVWVSNSIQLMSTGSLKEVYFLGVNWQHFTAVLKNESVDIEWETVGEDFGSTYNVLRSTNGGPWDLIAEDVQDVPGGGGFVTYRYTDEDVLPGNTYKYQIDALSDVWAGKEPRRSNPISVVAPVPILDGIVSDAVPNPFASEVAISVLIPETFQEGQGTSGSGNPVTFITRVPTPVEVAVYDVMGRLVRTIRNSSELVEKVTLRWDGRNQYGARVPSGVYFIKVKAGEDTGVRKVLLLK